MKQCEGNSEKIPSQQKYLKVVENSEENSSTDKLDKSFMSIESKEEFFTTR